MYSRILRLRFPKSEVQKPEMLVLFEQGKCSICELCVPACPTRAMKIRPTNQVFFE
jgi:formate hydrogenlyase subunit 6/NADH:ubiquinone oxidoreductase subunit I